MPACTLRLTFFVATLLLAMSTGKVVAQRLTSDIVGTVKDTTGALIPGATVELTQVDTSAIRSYTTDSTGNYQFAHLAPGHYTILVSKTGFKTQAVGNIDLLVDQTPHIDITLTVGEVAERVEVSAGGVQLLETENSTVGQVIQSKPIVGLPLNGRNFIQLTQLAPLMNPVMGGSVSCSEAANYTGAGNNTSASSSTLSAVGMREQNVSYLLNGIETRNSRWGNVTIRPSPDAIQEFKMEVTNFGPETGRSSVVVNTTLKSGSNEVHGSAYEFLRNSALDANDFFLNRAGQPKFPFQQNNFGFALGAPIELPHIYSGRNKTFFFVNYEGLRSRKGQILNGLFPSQAQLSGNLADDSAGTGIFPTSSPFCHANVGSEKCIDVINPSTGQAFPGNVIPPSLLDPQSQKWTPYLRAPNVAVPSNQPGIPSYNFIFSPKNKSDSNQVNLRFDHTLSSKDRFLASYSFFDVPHIEPGLFVLGGASYPWRAQVVAFNETHVFSPAVVNEFLYGYRRSRNAEVAETAFGKTNYATDIFKLQNFTNDPIAFGVPNLSVSGFSGAGSVNAPLDDYDRVNSLTDNLSIVHDRHTIKMGGSVQHQGFMYLCNCVEMPSFTFDGRFTGTGLGDMLLGIPYQVGQAVGKGQTITNAMYYAFYLGDNIRVRPDLTINLGIRYEYQQSPRDINGHQETYDPFLKRVVAVWRGEVRNGIVDPDFNNFAPRVGFAYSPKFLKNTSIRSSYGIFYATDNYNEFGFVAFGPDLIVDCYYYSDPNHPTLFMRNMVPNTCGLGNSQGAGIFGVNRRNRTPYVQEWNFEVQHTFGNNWLLELGYVGNVGQKIIQRDDANSPPYDPTGLTPAQDRRPNPYYGFILMSTGRGWSSYNGGFAKIEKRFSAGSYLLASYTWSKALDLGQDAGSSGGSVASRDFKVLDRGYAAFHTPHRFVASYIYELPFGRGRQLLPNISPVADKVIGGWSVNGIATVQAGQFRSINLGYDWIDIGGAFTRSFPNIVGQIAPSDRNYNHWWDKSSFALPGCPTLQSCPTGVHLPGDAPRNGFQMPGFSDFDLALLKETKLERLTLQFRAESFNALNHTIFGSPNNNLSSSSFGKITSVRISPREIQLGLKLLW
jgi:hypothetical protein